MNKKAIFGTGITLAALAGAGYGCAAVEVKPVWQRQSSRGLEKLAGYEGKIFVGKKETKVTYVVRTYSGNKTACDLWLPEFSADGVKYQMVIFDASCDCSADNVGIFNLTTGEQYEFDREQVGDADLPVSMGDANLPVSIDVLASQACHLILKDTLKYYQNPDVQNPNGAKNE